MASTIKVDNVQNTPGTNIVNKCGTTVTVGAASDGIRSAGNNLQASDGGNLISQSGTDITLGASGDTINLASGASQSGFGRTGTVDWDTSIKTGTVTAASGSGYFVNTTSGGITVNLPAGVAGSIVGISDYASTAASNNITVTPNGSEKINGVNADYTISTAGLAVTLVYADATRGWKSVTGSDQDASGAIKYVTATGGTPCTGAICGNFKVHTFSSPGTFCVSCAGSVCGSNTVDYFVVAGGGGGGGYGGGSAGAGGFRVSNSVGCIAAPVMSPLAAGTGISVSATPYAVTRGAGGAGGGPGYSAGSQGSDSVFSTITSSGGGFGVSGNSVGTPGGSGGGGRGSAGGGSGYAGGISAPVTSPIQGKAGGVGWDGTTTNTNGGGGGGAGADGSNAASATGGAGGVGSFVSPIFAVSCAGTTGPVPNVRYFSGGGGGGTDNGASPGGTPGAGGAGGGGAGGAGSGAAGTGGTAGSGGGGGGGGGPSPGGGAGGSGIVIIRYKFQ